MVPVVIPNPKMHSMSANANEEAATSVNPVAPVGHATAVPPRVAETAPAVVGRAFNAKVDEHVPPVAVPLTVAVAVAPAAKEAMVQVDAVTEPAVADTDGEATHGNAKPVTTMS